MKRGDLLIKSGGYSFLAKDVKIIGSSEGVGNKEQRFKTIFVVQVVLSGVSGALELRCETREERDAEKVRIEEIVGRYHESVS